MTNEEKIKQGVSRLVAAKIRNSSEERKTEVMQQLLKEAAQFLKNGDDNIEALIRLLTPS